MEKSVCISLAKKNHVKGLLVCIINQQHRWQVVDDDASPEVLESMEDASIYMMRSANRITPMSGELRATLGASGAATQVIGVEDAGMVTLSILIGPTPSSQRFYNCHVKTGHHILVLDINDCSAMIVSCRSIADIELLDI